ncbi:hypothetical protein BCR34DRAFT_292039 [Clohesyomyces aquaticus]|uniref:RRM domain-containing protein n=1 Tax=Clohesyomyces aquaticus TaxID=1231657 RepID=A0A1Y2A9H3_9PLEO|nr:hypothetical protein BCR34DRAFT_292039 [Clohesyomyces aquaticus]
MAAPSPPTVPAEVAPPARLSPANLEKRVVLAPLPSMALPQLADERQYHPGQALFSTDLNRKPPRKMMPPYPSVVARGYSDPRQAVADYAHFWYNKYPREYLCYFPLCGWTINDLWDDWDIHIDSPSFLTEVLKFICGENLHWARGFAVAWAEANKDRFLKVVALDMEEIYEPTNPLAVVDKVFVNGEQNLYPRKFLWHVINVMRIGIYNVDAQQQVEAQKQGEATSSKTSSMKPRNTGAVPQAAPRPRGGGIEAATKLPPAPSRPAQVIPGMQPPMVAPHRGPAPMIPFSDVNIQMPPGSLGQYVPVRGGSHVHPPAPPMGMSPQMNPVNMKTSKSRTTRSASGAYNQPPGMPGGWVENLQGPHPSSQLRQPSGTMSAMQSPRFHPQMPMSQPMAGPPYHMAPFSPVPAFASPMNVPNHMAQLFTPMMHPAMMAPQGIPYESPTMERGHQGYGHDPPARRMQMEDMTNSSQYPHAGLSRPDQRGNMLRRSSRVEKQQGLYNPYGAERPEFSNIPVQPVGKKNGRNSFSNNPGRGRKFSVGSYGRNAYGGASNTDRPEPIFHRQASRQQESGSQDSPYVQRANKDVIDLTIVNDSERGCSEDWIADKNEYVTYLWVADIPAGTEADDLKKFFQDIVEVRVAHVRLMTDKRQQPIAYVHFDCVTDARKALVMNNKLFHGRNLIVRVPKHFYMMEEPNTKRQWTVNYYEPYQQGVTVSTKGKQRMSYGAQDMPRNTQGPSLPGPAYSPQDARSDLQRQASYDLPTLRGSPEARKAKKQTYKSPSKKEYKEQDTVSATRDEANSSAALPAVREAEPVWDQPKPLTPKMEPAKIETPVVAGPEEGICAPPAALRTSEPVAKASPLTEERVIPSSEVTTMKSPKRTDEPPQATSSVPVQPPTQQPLETTPNLPGREEHIGTRKPTRTVAKSAITMDDAPKTQDELDVGTQSRDGEVASDDDQKHDVSFHSAKESLSDSGKQEEAKKPSVPSGNDKDHDPGKSPDPPGCFDNEPKEDVLDAGPKSEALADEQTTPNNMVPPPTQDTVQTSTSTHAKAPAVAEKKPGPKQTESLFPLAKPKNKKRKEKPKKQEKAKTEANEKSGPSKQSEAGTGEGKGSSALAMTRGEARTKAQGAVKSPTQAQSPKGTASLAESGVNAPDGKGEAWPPVESVLAAGSVVEDSKDHSESEMSGGKIPAPSTKSKDDTLRLLPQANVLKPLPPSRTSSPDARSFDAEKTNLSTVAPVSKDPAENEIDVEEMTKKKKIARDRVAVPKLNLSIRKVSDSGKSPTSDTILTPKHLSTSTTPVDENERGNPAQVSSFEINSKVPTNEKKTKAVETSPAKSIGSVASSSTLQRHSPSPTGAFYTPLQTPSGLPNPAPAVAPTTTVAPSTAVGPTIETAPPKKSKNKKKNKNKTAAMGADTTIGLETATMSDSHNLPGMPGKQV